MDEISEGSGSYSVLWNVGVQSECHCLTWWFQIISHCLREARLCKANSLHLLRGLPRQYIRICLVVYAKIAWLNTPVECLVGDDVLSCPGCYYCFSPTLLPSRRELELNCSRSHPVVCLDLRERSHSDITGKVTSSAVHGRVWNSHRLAQGGVVIISNS